MHRTVSSITLHVIMSAVCITAEVWYGVAAKYTNDEHVAAAMLLEW